MLEKEKKIEILETLYQDARIHANDLQNEKDISRQTISKIRKQFWEQEIIKSATFILNPHVLNLQYFFMEIRTNPAEPELLNRLKRLPGVISIDGVIGEWALMIKFELRSKLEFSKLLESLDRDVAQSLFQSYRIIESISIFKQGGMILTPPPHQIFLDDKKWTLIQMLRKNFNINKWPERVSDKYFTAEEQKELEKINLSREFDHFDEERIIERYTVCIDPVKAKLPDFHTKFYMRIKPKTVGLYTDLAEKLKYDPNIIELYRTGEDAGLLAIVRTEGLKGFKEWINHAYTDYPILDSHTTVVIDEHLPTIFPPTLKASKIECKKGK